MRAFMKGVARMSLIEGRFCNRGKEIGGGWGRGEE